MEKEQSPIIQACSINGEICRNGKRDDFKTDPLTGEKYFCHKWVKLVGADPQTAEPLNTWCCNEFAKIKLMLENALFTKQNAAALDRNNNVFVSVLPPHLQQRVIDSNPTLLINGHSTDGQKNVQ